MSIKKEKIHTLKSASSCWWCCCCWTRRLLGPLLHSLRGYWSSSQLTSETPRWWPWLCSPRASRAPVGKWIRDNQMTSQRQRRHSHILTEDKHLHCLCSVWSSAAAPGTTVSSSTDPCSVKQTRTLLVICIISLFLQEASYEYAQFRILEVEADSARRGQQNITALIQDSQLWIFFIKRRIRVVKASALIQKTYSCWTLFDLSSLHSLKNRWFSGTSKSKRTQGEFLCILDLEDAFDALPLRVVAIVTVQLAVWVANKLQ